MNDGLKKNDPVTKLGQAVGALAAGAYFKALGDRELDAPRPSSVSCDPPVIELANLALQLADSGREDADALAELVAMARGNSRDLKRGAAYIRFHGWNVEDVTHFRTNRLLRAAAAGEVAEPLTREELEWFAEVDALEAAPADVAYARLAARLPALLHLEDEIRSLARGEAMVGPLDAEREEAVGNLIWEKMNTYLGDDSTLPDPLLRTRTAWNVSTDHLRAVAGLPPLGND